MLNNPNAKDNLKPYEPGQSGNPEGRPLGSKNRSTVVRKLFELVGIIPDKNYLQLKALFPDLAPNMTAEEMGTMMQIARMITKADTHAYKALMDSAYGRPPQAIEVGGPDGGPLQVDDVSHLTADELRARISDLRRRGTDPSAGQP